MQRKTVESLSVIVITYYLTGLGSDVNRKACYEVGWLKCQLSDGDLRPNRFRYFLYPDTVGRKIIMKRMASQAKEGGEA